MPRHREREPLQKHTLNLFRGDFETLRDFHGRVGAGKIIRELVRGHIARTLEKARGRRTS